jgi:hypothetical protein
MRTCILVIGKNVTCVSQCSSHTPARLRGHCERPAPACLQSTTRQVSKIEKCWSIGLPPCSISVNIHSHLIGSIVFFLLALYAYNSVYLRQPNARVADLVVFAAFFFGVATCFLPSALYADLDCILVKWLSASVQLSYNLQPQPTCRGPWKPA